MMPGLDSDPARALRQVPGGPAPDPILRAAGEAHLERLRAGGAEIFDGPILAFSRLSGAMIEAYPASYFAATRSAGALETEARDAGRTRSPLREAAFAAAGGDPMRDGAGRVALVGVMIAVVLRRRGRRWLVIGRRSPRVASAIGTWAMIAGSLEPHPSDAPLPATIAAELTEEYPGLAEVAPIGRMVARAVVLGGCFNVRRLVPSVCVAVEATIDRPPAALGPLTAREFTQTRLVRLDPAGAVSFWSTYGPDDLAPPAAATAALLFARLGIASPAIGDVPP